MWLYFLSHRPPPTATLFPYTTLFRSRHGYRIRPQSANCRAGEFRLTFQRLHPYSADWSRRSEEHTSELQSRPHLVCRLLLEKKKQTINIYHTNDPYNLASPLHTHIVT